MAALLWFFHRAGEGETDGDETNLRKVITAILPPYVVRRDNPDAPAHPPSAVASNAQIALDVLPEALTEEAATKRVWGAFLDMEWGSSAQAGLEFVERSKASTLFCADFYNVEVSNSGCVRISDS